MYNEKFIRIMRDSFKMYQVTYSNGDEVEDLWYIDVCEKFLHGFSYCRRQDGKYNIIDHTGRIRFEDWFEELNVYRIGNSYLFELNLIRNFEGNISILCDDYYMKDLKSYIKVINYSNSQTYIIFKDNNNIPRIFDPITKEYIVIDTNISEISWDGYWFYVRRYLSNSEDKTKNIFDIDTKKYLFKEWFEGIEFFPENQHSLEKKGYFLVKRAYDMYNLISSDDTKECILKEDSRNIIFEGKKDRCYVQRSRDEKFVIFDKKTKKYKRKFWII